MSIESFNNTAGEVLKVAPPVAVSGLSFYGFTLPELIQFATLFYTFLIGMDKLYLMFLRYREERSKELKEIKHPSSDDHS